MSERLSVSVTVGVIVAIVIAVLCLAIPPILGALGLAGVIICLVGGWLAGVTIFIADYVTEDRDKEVDDGVEDTDQ